MSRLILFDFMRNRLAANICATIWFLKIKFNIFLAPENPMNFRVLVVILGRLDLLLPWLDIAVVPIAIGMWNPAVDYAPLLAGSVTSSSRQP